MLWAACFEQSLLEIVSLRIGADAVCMCEPKQKCLVDKKHMFLEYLCETIFTQNGPENGSSVYGQL